jgi:hypothetical protein
MMVVEEWDGLFVDDAQIKWRQMMTLDLGWPGNNSIYSIILMGLIFLNGRMV